MLYYFSICASSAFIVFPNTGCTSSGAISVKGRITEVTFRHQRVGEVECCSGRRSNRKYQIIIKQQVYINQPVAIYATDRLMRTSQFPFDLLRLLQYSKGDSSVSTHAAAFKKLCSESNPQGAVM